jgi:hypothetical protein
MNKQDILNQFEVWHDQEITKEAFDEFANLAYKAFKGEKAIKLKDKVIWRDWVNIGDEVEPRYIMANFIFKFVKTSETHGKTFFTYEFVQ